jgi:uncharacterized protein
MAPAARGQHRKETFMKQAALLFVGALLIPAAVAAQQQPARPALQKLFLYQVQPARPEMLRTAPTPEESKILDEQFRHLKDLTDKGVVLLVGRTLNTDATSFGIVIFHAVSEQEARRIMESDPAVQKGVFRATLFPFQVVLAESGAGR